MSGGNTVDMVYLDFAKAFDKVDHGVLLHKIKTLGITGKLGVWLYHFLTHRTHFVRLQGGISHANPVLSGVDDCSFLQNDLNSVYDWASCNNMSFNAQKFKYSKILHHLLMYTPVLVLISLTTRKTFLTSV